MDSSSEQGVEVYEKQTDLLNPRHHRHFHDAGQRLRKLFHPSGRIIHIARTPAEEAELKRTLSSQPESTFAVVLHGSPDHIDHLRLIHEHHARLRAKLREKYHDSFDEVEGIVLELEALAHEMRTVGDTEIKLDENFSRYGFSANIRTHDSPNESSANSLSGDSQDWDARRTSGDTMQMWIKPIIRQYHHKGLIWRANESEEVASYELFLDLIYVGIIAVSGDSAAEEATGEALLRFAITFIMSWKIWTDLTNIFSWFQADDIFRRFHVLFILTCLLGFTINIEEFNNGTYTVLVSFYLTARFCMLVYFVWMAWLLPMVKWAMMSNVIIILLPGILWIGSVHVEDPRRQGLIWAAIFLELCSSGFIMILRRSSALFGGLHKWIESKFDFFPAINIEHRIERTNAFVSLVLGYSVVALLYQNKDVIGINAFFGKAVLGLIQAFALSTIYFEMDFYNLHIHAIRRHALSAVTWLTIHLPFIMAYTISGAVLPRLVLVTDCANADPETLSEVSLPDAEPEISNAQRWFFCGGLGIALLCTNVISMTHVYRTPAKRVWLSKDKRLVCRMVIALVIVFLGFAESLNSLQLISTTTGLVALALAVEFVGNSLTCDGSWKRRRCTYSANCRVSKRDLEAKAKDGGVISLSELQGEKAHDVN